MSDNIKTIGAERIALMNDEEVQLLGDIIDHVGSGEHPCAGYDTPEMTRTMTLKGFALTYAIECVDKAYDMLTPEGQAITEGIREALMGA